MLYKIENIIIECDQDLLIINNEKVECTEKVLKAFNLFLNSQNQTIDKNLLVNVLWEGAVVSDDSLFKIIQHIRKIFKSHHFNHDVLKNVYGKGYKISPEIHIVDNDLELSLSDSNSRVKPNKLKPSLFLKASFILLFVFSVVVLINWMYNRPIDLLSSEDYLALKSQLLSDSNKAEDELLSLESRSLSDFDQLTLTALKGQRYYHQGNYKQSLDSLNLVVNSGQEDHSLVIADSYYVLGKISLYQSNPEKLLEYASQASLIYQSLNHLDGIFLSKDLKTEHLISIHQYQEAADLSHELLNEATLENNIVGQLHALTSLYQIYSLLNKDDESIEFIKKALNLALEQGNEKFISYSSGTLSLHSMNSGYFKESMKWANLTLKNALTQTSTNNFQQGFSYIYNILSPLGHNILAEKYLQKAIDVQNHFNSDGHLHTAELNLGILKVKLKKHKQALAIFNQLLSLNLSQSDRYNTIAWTAVNEFYLKDYIASYTTAKSVMNSNNVNKKSQLVAGIALILSSLELERESEATQVFEAIKNLTNPNWLIEHELFLSTAVRIANETDKAVILQQKLDFDTHLQNITKETMPNLDHLNELDKYLEKILK